ncbi:methyltransferase-like protein 25B [Diorhabda sublineata]|uniref:methyltransferase-like protein 25B n=1 Tax=Diorhabda sublineata TaxID=1163346 RepID=UPI0024E0B970|nr:methyltransferase-like protein 25B [Diorhabda sublineata]
MEKYLVDIQKRLYICNKIYEMYNDILNSYVSDFYLENHWSKLPKSWQYFFEDIDINELSNILDLSKSIKKKICPLALLCIRCLMMKYTLRRKSKLISKTPIYNFENNKFMNFFWKNVKLKKRHEIDVMAKQCYKSAEETDCFYIVDIGSGLGHLSRMLSYGYGFKVCTFEAIEKLTIAARELDTNFETTLNKRNIKHKNTFQTIHINKQITVDLNIGVFLECVNKAFNIDNATFGIVGLHPCGNLGATLLRFYVECPNIRFINIASCCYMKITLSPLNESCFPLSSFCLSKNITLSYLACEIACHAIENYSRKLKSSVEYNKLKIHAYRAALEKILVTHNPALKHSIIGSAKCDEDLTFLKYVQKVCDKFPEISLDEILYHENAVSSSWKYVVVFYSVRLLMAPLIENMILLDRVLYVIENGSHCEINPIFDCTISPRNQVLSATKFKS